MFTKIHKYKYWWLVRVEQRLVCLHKVLDHGTLGALNHDPPMSVVHTGGNGDYLLPSGLSI